MADVDWRLLPNSDVLGATEAHHPEGWACSCGVALAVNGWTNRDIREQFALHIREVTDGR